MSPRTLRLESRGPVLTVTFDRPEADNAIDAVMIDELGEVLARCEDPEADPPVSVLVLRGAPEVFCTGGDLRAMVESGQADEAGEAADPAPLYDLWARLAAGPFVVVSLVRGRVNAGGLGFVAASDVVLAEEGAEFSLSELLFGLFPACVLPFLVARVGRARARYVALMTRPFGAAEAAEWGLVDAFGPDPETLLRQHLLRLRRLGRPAIGRFKAYMGGVEGAPEADREAALAANRAMFRDPTNRRNIRRYVAEGKFPWEP